MSRTSITKSNQKDSLIISQAWILSLTAFLAPLIGGKLNPFGSGILRILAFITGMLFIARGIRETSGIRTNAVLWLSIILFALGLLSLMSSASIHETLFALMDLGAYLLILLIIANFPDQGSVIRILASLLASAFIVSALGIREYLLSAKPDWRTFATFFNPDFLAGFMAIVLSLTLAWYLSPSRMGISIASGLALLGILGTLLLSGSRLGALCAIGGAIIFALFALAGRSFKKHQAVRLAVLIVPILLVVIFLSTPLTNRVASVQSESHSAAFRFETWKGTIRVAKAYPICGTGLGTFQLIYPKYAHVGFTKMAHNSYLQLASESGIAAPIILVLLIGFASLHPISALLKRQMRREPSDDDLIPDRQLILCGIIGGVAASAARNIVDSDWYVSAIGYSFAILLGAGIALASESPASKVPVNRLAAFILSGFLAIAIIVSLLAITAYQYQLSGDTLARNGNLDEAINAYQTATRLDYLNSEHLRALGQVYAARASIHHDINDLQNAEHFLLLAIRRSPTSAKGYYQLGQLYEFAGENEKALNAYQQALKWDPNAVQILFAKARLYENMGRSDEAFRTYNQIVEIEKSPYEQIKAMPEYVEPVYIFAHYAIARHLEQKGNLRDEIEEYNLALDRIARFEKSLKEVGDVLEASGKRNPQREAEIREIASDSRYRIKKLHGAIPTTKPQN